MARQCGSCDVTVLLFHFYSVLRCILLSRSLQKVNTICLDEDVSLEMAFQVTEADRGKHVCSSPTTGFSLSESARLL